MNSIRKLGGAAHDSSHCGRASAEAHVLGNAIDKTVNTGPSVRTLLQSAPWLQLHDVHDAVGCCATALKLRTLRAPGAGADLHMVACDQLLDTTRLHVILVAAAVCAMQGCMAATCV